MRNATEITPTEAMLGLVTWLKLSQVAGCQLHQTDTGISVIQANIAFANGFQIGLAEETQTLFIAFDPALWWFPWVWDEVCLYPDKVVFQVSGDSPVILVLPADMPSANSRLIDWRQTQAVQRCLLTPFAQTYLEGLAISTPAVVVSDESELALDDAAFVSLVEQIQW